MSCVYVWHDQGYQVVTLDETPVHEACYAFVHELYTNGHECFFRSWHGGRNSGGWDEWQLPPEFVFEPTREALEAAWDIVAAGLATKVANCPYCED